MLKHSPARTEELVSRIRGLDSAKRQQLFARLHQAGVAVAGLPIVAGSDQGPWALSFAQQRQWFLWQLEPHSCAYNLPAALRLRGTLNLAALRQAFSALRQRQASLRSRFVEQDGEVMQVIDPAAPFILEVECPSVAGDAREALVRACVEAELAQPFDLLHGPLWRVRLVALADDEHLLLITLHHIVTDGWSMGVMVEELLELYAAACEQRPASLPALAVQYADYAQWQREWMAAGGRELQLAYWQAQLGGEQPVLALPNQRARPARQSFRGAAHEVAIAPALAAQLQALASSAQVTPFAVLLASLQVLLRRYSGLSDVRVGVPTANRNRLETERLIGLFVNTQVLKGDWDENVIVRDLLSATAHTAVQAQQHQDLPFEQLVEVLQPERSLSHNPLFQVMFNHQQHAAGLHRQVIAGVQVEALALAGTTAQLDLTLETCETPEGFTARFVYATDLFDATFIARMAGHWLNLLQGMVERPQARVADLALLSEAEREAIVACGTATAVEYPLQQPVQQLIEAQVDRTPDAEALVFGEVRLSYAQLDARANQLAHKLVEQGVGPDVIVGIAAERSVEMVVGLLAILKAGGAYVPLDPEYPADRLSYMFQDSGIALLLTQSHLQLPLPEGLSVLHLDTLGLEGYATSRPQVSVSPENLAYVIYTSGSTGKPKGAGNRHSALTNRLCWMQQAYGLDGSDTVLQKTPFSFDVSVWEFFWPLMTGARLAVAGPGDHRDPARLVELINQHQVSTLHFVPSMLQVFLQDEQVSSCISLKRIVCSGEALQVDAQQGVFAKLPNAGLYNLYGPTEAAIDVTHWTCRDEGRDTVPIGQPIANLSTYVLDNNLEPVPVGVVGELYLGGEGLARGYHRRPALTAERFVTSPFGDGARLYRTGDLASQRSDGVIEYRGRIDHQVKIRGLRIELGEIEARLLEQNIVREAAVLAVPVNGSLQLVAYLVAGDEDSGALREVLKQHLPDYMVPAHFIYLPALPVSPNGKLERKALPVPDASHNQQEYVAPHSELEQRIAQIWQEVLTVEQVGLHDDFFSLGGHSLLATQVVSRVRKELGIELELRTLFEQPTLGSFCKSLDGLCARDAEPIAAADRQGPLPLSFAQERQWFLWQLDPGSAAYHVPMALRLRGPLDQQALQRSFDALVARHEPLRTTFAQRDGELQQVIAEQAALPLQWASLPPGASLDARIEALVLAETARTFDLANGPLLRVCLAPLGPDEHLLVLTQHHIVSDAWSIQRLVHELIELYSAASEGRQAQLAELPIQYADFAQWQRQWMQGPQRTRQLAYWQAQLGTGEGVLTLPTDFQRPPQISHRGAQVQVRLPNELTRALRQLAQREQASPFMLLLASFQLLLHRYSGQTDIRVGVPVANRNRVETEALLGFFVNTQVLKVELQPTASVRELLRASKAAALDAQANQDLPFEQLVEVLQPQRSLSYNPLFQVMYNHQNSDPRGARLGDLGALQVEALHWDSVTAQVDLTLDTFDAGDTIAATLTYATDLFQASTIERLGRHWRNLLQAMVRAPDQALAQLPMLDDRELQALAGWSVDTPVYPTERSIDQLIQAQAERRPDALAVICAGQQLTFAQLETRANQLAHLLIARGIGAETLVGVALERSPQMLVALLAVLKAGAAYAPLDLDYPRERLAYLIEDAGIALLLSESHLAERLPLPEGLACLALDQADLAAQPAWPPARVLQPDNLAYVIYTSGSTGKPKGVAVAHGPLVMHCLAIGERYEMSEQDCELHFMSFAFDGAHERWLTALSHGARLLIRDGGLWTPEQTYQAMHRHGVTVAAFPPAYLQQLAEHAERDGNPPPVRVYCFGGDAVPQASYDLARRALRPRYIINGYGPTETVVTPLIWKATEQDGTDAAYAPIGTRIGDRSVRVLDDQLQWVPVGHPGELYLGGAGLARGYLHRPGMTAERFVPDPYGAPGARTYRSGDLVRQRPDGVVDYLGRVDHQVKVRGFRIELGEIEACLQGMAGVREALVIARQGPTGAQLAGYVVAQQPLAPAQQEALRDALNLHLRANLPGYMVPSYLLVIDGFALTPNGKIDRKALPQVDTAMLQRHFVAPQAGLEQQVAEVWQAVLKLERVGRDDNFFELGGHSLLATQATAQLQLALAADIALDLIFKAATLHEYSAAVAACLGDSDREQDLSDMHDLLDELETF